MNEFDYLNILIALKEIPFGVGKKLLVDFLKGNEKNKSIEKNNLKKLKSFGSLGYQDQELTQLINNLILNDLISFKSINKNKFLKVLILTKKGRDEIKNPKLNEKKISFMLKEEETKITEKDKENFIKYFDFLKNYNDEQKKAIIDNNKSILCIAGAGTGKTTVLTKRIEFLIKYKNVNPKEILAITFTRKARKEMKNRLKSEDVRVETFNSFCEKILIEHEEMIYEKKVKIIKYEEKIKLFYNCLKKINIKFEDAINLYFDQNQRKQKTINKLQNIFINDCFFIRDYFKLKNKNIEKKYFFNINVLKQKKLDLVYLICKKIDEEMSLNNFRDFADQLIDTILFFKKNPNLILKFSHILIDEYQDINSIQINLIDLLNSENIFCVGDPRQSIYGFRGSDIRYILNFENKYENISLINLKKNYRSDKDIVDLINESIKDMGFKNLQTTSKTKGKIKLINFENEKKENAFLIEKIKQTKIRNEVFILSRTNKRLNQISKELKENEIKHLIKSDEHKTKRNAKIDEVVLSTIHSIKGLEAKIVFVVGCTGINFPCKSSEHPVIDMIKMDEYDVEEEEKRLFYVAMSRAKNYLYLLYSGKKPTYFINSKMKKILKDNEMQSIKGEEIQGIEEEMQSIEGEKIQGIEKEKIKNIYKEKVNRIEEEKIIEENKEKNINENKIKKEDDKNRFHNINGKKIKEIKKKNNFLFLDDFFKNEDKEVIDNNKEDKDIEKDKDIKKNKDIEENEEINKNNKKETIFYNIKNNKKEINKNELNEKQRKIFEKIKKYRFEKSKEKNVPAYIIFNNKTLFDIINKNPKNLKELENIYGFGEKKIQEYGLEILELIK